jgi:addiction module HigA family antidote
MTNSGLPPIHPGEFLDELLLEMQVPQVEFARAVDIAPDRLSAVIRGEQPVTAELALLFARALDQSPHYWLNLQAEYDLTTASAVIGARLERVRTIPHAAQPKAP